MSTGTEPLPCGAGLPCAKRCNALNLRSGGVGFPRPRRSAGPGPGDAMFKTEKTDFDFPATFYAQTPHFKIYYDPDLGSVGPEIAEALLITCEADLQRLSDIFGIATLPNLPISLIPIPWSDQQGAYHNGCDAVEIYCGVYPDVFLRDQVTPGLVVAEVTEVFEAAQGLGWDCAKSNGEAVSRELMIELYPIIDTVIGNFGYTTVDWLNSTRPDFVTKNDDTDSNDISIGCGLLFLNFLQYLGYDWPTIVRAGASTFKDVYQKLTGSQNALGDFMALVNGMYPPSGVVEAATERPLTIDPRVTGAVLL